MKKNTLLYVVAALCFSAGAYAEPVHYDFDPSHTFPSVETDHFGGLSVWRGLFKKTKGYVVMDRAKGTGDVTAIIDTSSVEFGLEDLNKHVRSDEILDVQKFPEARYDGKLTGFVNQVPTQVVGNLTLKGVTRPVNLTVRSFKCMMHPMAKREVCGADLEGSFSRDDFGVDVGKAFGFNMQVRLHIQVEALRAEQL